MAQPGRYPTQTHAMNLLIGAVKHCGADRLEVWARSAEACFPSVKKVLLCLDEEVPSSLRNLVPLGFEVIHQPSPPQTNIDIMKYERHNAIREYLLGRSPQDVVLTTDTFDVCFQSDPFAWYEQHRNNDLLLGSEGITIEQEHWNRRVITKGFPLHIGEVLKNDVFCAGVIMGSAEVVADLMLMVYNFTKNVKSEDSEGIDQGALNVILASHHFRNKLQVTTTSENFVVHCAVSGPTELFIPWGFKNAYKYDLPKFDGHAVVNHRNEPYCIVHQYNRVKEWDSFFNTKYRRPDWGKILPAIKPQPSSTTDDTAIVVCTRANSSYADDWNRTLRFTDHDYLLCDVGNGKVPEYKTFDRFVADNVINYTEQYMREALNFHSEISTKHWWNQGGGRNAIWFYPHFRMLYFYLTHPNYNYYWFFDEDVTFPQHNLDEFVAAHAHLTHDCMITYLFSTKGSADVLSMTPGMGSYHAADCNWLSHYPGDGDKQNPHITTTYGSYFPLVRLSNKAMRGLWEEHGKGHHGYSEGYVPTTLAHLGQTLYSIYDKNSEVKADKRLVVHHRRYLELLWKHV